MRDGEIDGDRLAEALGGRLSDGEQQLLDAETDAARFSEVMRVLRRVVDLDLGLDSLGHGSGSGAGEAD